jgi:hypothetical protein
MWWAFCIHTKTDQNMQGLNEFYRGIEKTYLPNKHKDQEVGTRYVHTILEGKVDIKTCESIFTKALAVLALDNSLTIQRLKDHLASSSKIALFNEEQLTKLHNFFLLVQELSTEGKGISQVEAANQRAINTEVVKTSTIKPGGVSQSTIVIIILIVSIILAGFFWFELRPTLIKKNCYVEVYEGEDYSAATVKRDFANCLLKHGITE